MKNLKTRIKDYKKAIEDYEADIIKFRDSHETAISYYGFCHYFNFIRRDEMKQLLELWSLKPRCHYKKHRGFWWNPQNKEIRIKKLKEALVLAEQKLNKK